MQRRTRLATTALTALVLAATPGSALGGTIDIEVEADSSLTLVFTAKPGEVQQLRLSTLTAGEGKVDVSDGGADFQLAPFVDQQCDVSGARRISCPGIQQYRIDLGDGDDLFSVKERGTDPNRISWPKPADSTVVPFVTVTGGAGADTIMGSPGNDTIDGGPGNDQLWEGAGGNDTVLGGEGDDDLGDKGGDPEGFFASELFVGTDTYRGGGGVDKFWAGSLDLGVDVSFDDVRNDRAGETVTDDVGADFEDFYGTDADDRIIANDAANDIFLGNGDDVADGRGGDDTIRGFNDNDTLTGGAGVDALDGEFGNDTLDGRDGELDAVYCGIGADTARADRNDDINSCETLDVPAAPTTSTPTTTTPGTTTGGGGGGANGGGGVPITPTPGPSKQLDEPKADPVGLTAPASTTVAALRRGLTLTVRAPAAGKGTAKLLNGTRLLAGRTFTAKAAGALKVRLGLTAKARRTARRLRGRRLSLRIVFTPTGGKSSTERRTLRVR